MGSSPSASPCARARALTGVSRSFTWGLGPLLSAAVVLLALPALAAGETCPNAVFRTGPSAALPECRAFEQVTPENKNAGVIPPGAAEALAPNGESLAFNTVATMLPDETGDNGPEGATYSTARTAGGWVTTSLMPQAKEYDVPTQEALEVLGLEGAHYLEGLAEDGRAALWHTRRVGVPAGDSDLYLETSPGAPLQEVGPLRRAGIGVMGVVGSSNDLSHVLLSGEWTFEGAGGGGEKISTLFEYVGLGMQAPLLVGVDEEGQLISKCGTDLDSVSASGTAVIFTARACNPRPAADEVYARVGNGEAGAHTVDISEPTPADCACVTGTSAKAVYLGASEDGSRVFFETEQPLLAGATGMNIYEYDFDAAAGERVTLVSGGDATVSNPVAQVKRLVDVSGDGSHVYFTADGVLTNTPNSQEQTAAQGAENLYVFNGETGGTAFITSGSVGGADVTVDGRFLVFTGQALTPDSTGEGVFEYDAATGSLARASIGEHGYDDDGNLTSATLAPKRSVAADGAVFFYSSQALTPAGAAGVYEYREGQVYWIAATPANGLIGVDASGDDVFFFTTEGLAPTDLNESGDIYDARVDGGFASYLQAPECSGDECQGPLSASPTLLSPGSEFQAGGGNFKAVAPAAAGPVKSKAIKQKKKKSRPKKKRNPKKRGRKAVKSSLRVQRRSK